MAASQFVSSLFVTLRRSYAGTPWFHRRVLEALGLKTRHQCLEKPNNSSIRGMLQKVRCMPSQPHTGAARRRRWHCHRRGDAFLAHPPVRLDGFPMQVPHLVTIETDRMFYLRSMKAYHEQQCRPPVIVHHDPPPTTTTVQQPPRTAFAKQQLEEHVFGTSLGREGGAARRSVQPPRKHFLALRSQRRAALLSKHGLFSAAAIRQHQQDIAPKPYAKRAGTRL